MVDFFVGANLLGTHIVWRADDGAGRGHTAYFLALRELCEAEVENFDEVVTTVGATH